MISNDTIFELKAPNYCALVDMGYMSILTLKN